jgi:hypothetical protein
MTVYQVTSSPVPPYTGTGLSTAEIIKILSTLDPAAAQEAGAAHTSLGQELGTMASHLTQEAQTLAQNWSGTAARTALAQLQRLQQQTTTLATQASQTGAVLTWLGTRILPSFRPLTDPAQAQKHLSELSAHLVTANSSLPTQIGGPATAQLASSPGPAPHPGPASPTSSAASPAIPKNPTNPMATFSTTNLTSPGRNPAISGNRSGAGAVPNAGSSPDTGGHDLSGSGGPGRGGSGEGPAAAVNTPLTATPAHPVTQVSSLQSAAPAGPGPVPGSTPATTPAPAAPATTGVTGTPAPVPLATSMSTRGTSGTSGNRRQTGDQETRKPADQGLLPGTPGTVASPVPEVAGAPGPALSAHPLPELPSLDGAAPDSGLSGCALPLPAPPVDAATATAVPAVPADSAGSAAAIVATPGPGGSANRGVPGGLPMAGGVSAQPDHERQRQSWASEDRNLWGLPAGCVPPVIEGD